MANRNGSGNVEYYPFFWSADEDAPERNADFILAFDEMDGCLVDHITILDGDDGIEVDVPVNRESIESAFEVDGSLMGVSVVGSYKGESVMFIFSGGIVLATNYTDNRDEIEKIVLEIISNTF